MGCQFLLFQSLCVFLIASSTYGGQLPDSITSQYYYCYELTHFYTYEGSATTPREYPHVDNICMDSDKSSLHFLSSAQGGTTSIISGPISEMTVTFLSGDTLNIRLRMPYQPVLSLVSQFQDPTQAHIWDVYNSIYQHKLLSRHEVTIGRFQDVRLDPNNSERILGIYETVLSQHIGLYTEFFTDSAIIFTFKEENANGDVVKSFFITMPNSYSISDVRVNNNVVLRYNGGLPIYYILTFRDEWQADRFIHTLRDYFDPEKLVSVPHVLEEVLEETHM